MNTVDVLKLCRMRAGTSACLRSLLSPELKGTAAAFAGLPFILRHSSPERTCLRYVRPGPNEFKAGSPTHWEPTHLIWLHGGYYILTRYKHTKTTHIAKTS